MIIFTTFKEYDWRVNNAAISWVRMEAVITTYEDSDRDIVRNESDTPILPDLFAKVERNHKDEELFAYVNSDIILFPDFAEALEVLDKLLPKFLMVGRRWNWQRPRPLKLDDLDRNKDMFVREVMRHGKLFNPATDYFGFRRGTFDYDEWPKFAIGRYYWDAWIWWHALQEGIPVVDCTQAVLAVHQNHPPAHRAWSAEGEINRGMAQDVIDAGIDLDDMPYYLTQDLRIVER